MSLINKVCIGASAIALASTSYASGQWDTFQQSFDLPGASSAEFIGFDGQGNATVISDSDTLIAAFTSIGSTNTWQQQTVANVSEEPFNVEGTVLLDGRATIIFRNLSQGIYSLKSSNFESGLGWSPVQTIFSTDEFFQTYEISSDAQGNRVVLVNIQDGITSGSDDLDGIYSLVYTDATAQWSTPALISPATANAQIVNILRSDTRNQLSVLYTDNSLLVSQDFDSFTGQWSLPQTAQDTDYFASTISPDERFPAVVDDNGNITVVWEDLEVVQVGLFGSENRFTLFGSRRENGIWLTREELVAQSDDIIGATQIGIDVNASGDVIAAYNNAEEEVIRVGIFRFETINVVNVYALHFDAQTGWQPREQIEQYENDLSGTITRVAWYQGSDILAVHEDSFQLFENGAWQPRQAAPSGVLFDLHTTDSNAAEVLSVRSSGRWFRAN